MNFKNLFNKLQIFLFLLSIFIMPNNVYTYINKVILCDWFYRLWNSWFNIFK